MSKSPLKQVLMSAHFTDNAGKVIFVSVSTIADVGRPSPISLVTNNSSWYLWFVRREERVEEHNLPLGLYEKYRHRCQKYEGL